MLADLRAAAMVLTRFPVGRPPDVFARAVWAYPVIGAALGAIGGVVLLALRAAGASPLLAASFALAAMTACTGGLHEDGLADSADALGGRDRAARLAIMRDSRIGSYGATALVLSFLIRAAALAAIPSPLPALIASGALSRGMIALALWRLPPARSDGLAASLGAAAPARIAVGLALAAPFILLAPSRAIGLDVAGLTIGGAIIRATRARLGGYTGDTLGAVSVVVECSVLSLTSTRLT